MVKISLRTIASGSLQFQADAALQILFSSYFHDTSEQETKSLKIHKEQQRKSTNTLMWLYCNCGRQCLHTYTLGKHSKNEIHIIKFK